MTQVTKAEYAEGNLHRVSNDADGTPAADVAAGDTSFDMESGQGSDMPTDTFVIFVPSTTEYIFVGNRSGDTLQDLTRDFDGDLGGGQPIGDGDEVRVVRDDSAATTITDLVEELSKTFRGDVQREVTFALESTDGTHSHTIVDGDGVTVFDVASDGVWSDGTTTVYDGSQVPLSVLESTTVSIATGDGIDSDGDGSLELGGSGETLSVVAGDIAGAGLTTSGSPADIDVGSGTGISVNANDVAVDTSHGFTWGSSHTWDTGAGTNAVVTESAIDRASSSAETFNVQNSGTGSMTLQQDGTAVVVETRNLTGGDGVQTIGDLSEDRTVAVALETSGGLAFTSGEIGVDEANVDHDALSNFVANEHVDHSTVSITGGDGLTGGGDLTTSRTLAVGSGTGIAVAADAVSINPGDTITWTASQAFEGGLDASASTDLTVPKVSSDPGTPANGQVWYRTDTDEYRVQVGGATHTIDTTAV